MTKSHSRPHVSNDNPFSESQFKTLKYRPDFPEAFSSIEHARAFLQAFFTWYTREHRHVGLAPLAPEMVHHGHADTVIERRAEVLTAAYLAHPDRFISHPPQPLRPARVAYINRPATDQESSQA